MSYLVARSLSSAPWIEIYEVENEVPGPALTLEPPIFANAEKVQFPRNNSQMAIATKFRREFVEGIGNPAEVIPSEGIRLIAPNDGYILFGGSSTVAPVFYQRRGPSYLRWEIAIPEGEHAIVAAFSESSRYLFVVTSDNANEVKVLRREAEGFEQIYAIDAGFVVTGIQVTTGDGYLAITGSTAYVVHQFLDSQSTPFPLMTGLPTGTLLAISPDVRWYVIDTGNDAVDLEVHEHSGGVWTKLLDLVDSDGANRIASFSPDGKVLQIAMGAAGTQDCPAFYDVGDGEFAPTGGNSRANNAGRSWRSPIYSRDSAWMGYAHSDDAGASSVVELYERAYYLPEIYEAVAPMPLDEVVSMAQVQSFAFGDGSTWLAIGGNTAPYLAIYKNDGAGNFVRVSLFGGPTRTVSGLAFSPDGTYLAAIYGGSAPGMTIFKRSGDAFGAIADPTPSPYNAAIKAEFSADGNWLFVGSTSGGGSGTSGFRAYKRTGDAFSETGVTISGDGPGGIARHLNISADASSILLGSNRGSGSGPIWAIWRRSGDTITRSLISSTKTHTYIACSAMSPDGELILFVEQDTANTSGTIQIRKWNGSGFDTLTAAAQFSEVPTGAFASMFFNSDASLLFFVMDGAGENMLVFRRDGDTFIRQEGTLDNVALSLFDGFDSNVISGDDSFIISGGSSATLQMLRKIVPDPATALLTYQHRSTRPFASEFAELWGFSPDGALMHFGGAVGHHSDPESFAADVAAVPFDGEYAASQITDVLWGRSGKFVLYDNPDGPSVSVRTEESGGFTMSKNLNGLFVSKYIRDGDVLRETEYVVHDVDAQMSNLVYSKTGVGFSYFLMDQPTTSGRYIYDTEEEKFDLKGVDYDARMTDSFLAFSPWETHLVVTYEMSDGNHELRLFSLGANRVYALEDTELVDFGPVDISPCDDVLVAHGAAGAPFSLFKVVEMALVPEAFPAIDWQYTGFIWDIALSDDCEGMYVITDDELVSVGIDDGGIRDETPVDDPPEDDGSIEIGDGPDGPIIRQKDEDGTGGGGGGGGGGGIWEPGPGGIIDTIGYHRYSTVHVTYRR